MALFPPLVTGILLHLQALIVFKSQPVFVKLYTLYIIHCRWGGRNHRGKITVHVGFSEELDMRPYSHPSSQAHSYVYRLSAIVMHHGRGFGSGHYTAYCWNEEAGRCISSATYGAKN